MIYRYAAPHKMWYKFFRSGDLKRYRNEGGGIMQDMGGMIFEAFVGLP